MAKGYDGSITIDSSINPKGFNAGIKAIVSSMSGFGKVLGSKFLDAAIIGAKVLGVIAVIAKAIIGIGIALGTVIVALGILGIRMFNAFADSLSQTDPLYEKITQIQGAVDNLKGAFMAAFGTLLQVALPVIMTVVQWLTNLVNTTSMVIAALMGQGKVWQYVAGSADKAKKATKGALAGFDELNVLQQKDVAGGTLQLKEVPIDPEVMAWVDGLKKSWDDFVKGWFEFWEDPIGNAWEWIKQAATDAWQWIATDGADWAARTVNEIVKWFGQAWEDIKIWAQDAWENIKIWAGDAWEWIKQAWADVGEWFKSNVTDPIAEWFAQAWENIKQSAAGAWDTVVKWALRGWQSLTELWAGLGRWFNDHVIEPVRTFFRNLWEGISLQVALVVARVYSIWLGVVTWFRTNIIDPLKDRFATGLEWIREKWEGTFSGIRDFVKGTVNTIIDFINGMIRAVAGGINSVIGGLNSIRVTIPDWVPGIGGQGWALNIPNVPVPQIPRLASGAVIPPNAEFAAILGDQRSGRNIEAPEGLIRQIVKEEIGKQKIIIEFAGTGEEIARLLRPKIKQEDRRIGISLITGATP